MACEAEDDGDGIWTPEQWRDYPRIVASGLYLMHRDQTWYCSHRTWALTPPSKPGRKIDPTGIMDPWMAAWVSVLFRNPKAVPRQGMPTAADLTSTGGFTVAEADAILKAIADVKATVNHQVAMLMFGENRDASKADPHPDSLQTLNTKLSKFIAESGARETALIAAVTKLAAAGGVPISKEEIIQTLDDAVSTGFETLDLRLVNQSLDPTPSA
jgi:hypothetical protein